MAISNINILAPGKLEEKAKAKVKAWRIEKARKAAEERREPAAAAPAQNSKATVPPQDSATQGPFERSTVVPPAATPLTSENPFAKRAPLSEGLQHPNASRTKEELDRDLLCATKWSKKGSLEQLIKEGADVNARDGDGYTALIKAATDRRLEDAKLLVDAGADVDAGDENGRTALMESSSLGHTGLVVLLVKSKANVNAKDSMGRTALDFAKMWGRTDVAEILEGKGAKPGEGLP